MYTQYVVNTCTNIHKREYICVGRFFWSHSVSFFAPYYAASDSALLSNNDKH